MSGLGEGICACMRACVYVCTYEHSTYTYLRTLNTCKQIYIKTRSDTLSTFLCHRPATLTRQINVSETWAILAAFFIIIMPVLSESWEISKARKEQRRVADGITQEPTTEPLPTTSEAPETGRCRKETRNRSLDQGSRCSYVNNIEQLQHETDSGKTPDPREPVFS